jgi:hypothetical protein
VQSTVGEVVPGIFHHEEDRDLVSHGPEGGERYRSRETKELSHWVEEPMKKKRAVSSESPPRSEWTRCSGSILPNLRKFHGEVTQEHELSTVPLLAQRGNLALSRD